MPELRRAPAAVLVLTGVRAWLCVTQTQSLPELLWAFLGTPWEALASLWTKHSEKKITIALLQCNSWGKEMEQRKGRFLTQICFMVLIVIRGFWNESLLSTQQHTSWQCQHISNTNKRQWIKHINGHWTQLFYIMHHLQWGRASLFITFILLKISLEY